MLSSATAIIEYADYQCVHRSGRKPSPIFRTPLSSGRAAGGPGRLELYAGKQPLRCAIFFSFLLDDVRIIECHLEHTSLLPRPYCFS
jgi:hypothetical protein